MLRMIADLIFWENHWLFTAHYLQVACFFKMLFIRHTEDDLTKMQRRRYWIKTLTISMCAIAVLVYVGRFIAEIVVVRFLLYWVQTLLFCFVACINILAMRHINRSYKSLAKFGIFTDKVAKILYICLWSGLCLAMIGWNIVFSIRVLDKRSESHAFTLQLYAVNMIF